MFEVPTEKAKDSGEEPSKREVIKSQNVGELVVANIGIESKEQVEQVAERALKIVDDLEKIEDESVKKSASLKVFHILKRMSRGIVGATTLLAVVGGANYGRTRYEITEKQSKDGIEYIHEDPETTRNLNVLLGKEPLPEALKVKMHRSDLAEEYRSFHMDIPDDLAQMDEEDLKKRHRELHRTVLGDIDYIRADAELERSTGSLMRFDPKVYKAIWDIQKEFGNPKIRFVFNEPGEKMESSKYNMRSGRPHYEPVSNTLYVNPLDKGKDWLAELAHAKQFDENPMRAYALGIGSGVSVLYRMATEDVTFRQAYDRYEYHTPGTLEHEAHSVLEKEIMQNLDDAFKRSESDNEA